MGVFRGGQQVTDSFLPDAPSDDDQALDQEKAKASKYIESSSSYESSSDDARFSEEENPLAKYAAKK